MDFALTVEDRDIRDTVRRFVQRELLPREPEFLRRERSGEPGLPHDELAELQRKAREFGFWGLATPAEWGGMDLPAMLQSLVTTELATTCVPFRFGGAADNILFAATPAQQEAYLRPTIEGVRRGCFALTEPGAGSDARAISTTARRDGADWLINGQKTFITGGHEADYAIVFAVAEPGITAFLIDREQGWTSSPIPTMGSWHEPATLFLDDVRVPDSAVLGEVGTGFELAMRWIGKGRHTIAAQCVGIATRCLQMAVSYANTRETFGRTIGSNQGIGWMLADSETELEAGRWLALRAAWDADRGADARHAAALAKLYCTGMVGRVVDRALQIHGGLGYTRELPLEWWYRSVRVMRIFEGTDEMQRMIISRDLLRGHSRIGGHLAHP
ncbi:MULTISPECIES: acyl-CoA dehydrogenase family protein [Pseudonocardia]|uniref:Medium-chain specific acyl-CoA dehydrogenase, mitochondrial n=2 Tax=Pseudonocardia TaxID=1847 RepID=A0A1Y2MKE9_PSEAH|nr:MULTISPECIES: acyl-CoA dehydrogenase family protein [Pseudonocardia]OSY35746.1 Acyl-CoA dehydrogenase [Pseudonocardia autotrophica]TDN74562.1 alkylation response protein AidB-like acyl-CoA dehydrogenase [Pseudonocardia autotrophica]BBG05330.1 acyl-CoA dehydrogenase [Pseudonocardia autotrophica]GEC27454.1 acyl-CoA dehydrogenase [Pseudonocardia saturnea]